MSTEDVATHNEMLLDWLEQYDQGMDKLYRGQILTGTVMQIRPNEVLIDVGGKAEGVVDGKELERLNAEDLEALEEGDEIKVYVVRTESVEGHPILSITQAQMEKDWEFAAAKLEADEVFEAEVSGANKGGLIVHLGELRAFVPASQVSSLRRSSGEAEDQYQTRLKGMIGRTLRFKVLELERTRNRLILSERAANREWRKARKEELLDTLEEGQVVSGQISSLADFGAFVDLGGADGLVHLSELSWGRVQHPSEVVQVGGEIEVMVINVDAERKRIGLSLKRLQNEPWVDFVSQHEVDQRVEVTITKLAPFGAFARVEGSEVEGLIHISELSNEHVEHPGDIVAEGEKRIASILRLDTERKRLGLSLRALEGEEFEEFEDEGNDEEPFETVQDEAVELDETLPSEEAPAVLALDEAAPSDEAPPVLALDETEVVVDEGEPERDQGVLEDALVDG